MLKAGIKFKLYLADYFAFLNNKLGGDLENIRNAGKYFIEVWKASGVDMDKVEIIWAKDLMDGIKYWDRFLKVGKEISLERNLRATTIMGRKQGEKLSMGQLFYPPMQVTDIFEMNIDICQLGMDQRRANILAREIADKLKWKKPVAAHHHIIIGLQGIKKGNNDEETLMQSKMSKSDPKSAIYMHESYEELKNKVNSAYCPEKVEDGNPLLEYCKYIIFKNVNSIKIERPKKFGGEIEFFSYEELKNAYVDGKLHPMDLKIAVANELEKLIKPVREYFEKNKKAKELYNVVKQIRVTR